ncbi:proteobacterial dedicated sortase system response regulator [Wenzhouxiangella sp. XN79A]|uniref:proteobacterial dedicated sortase system response regulator n=1 Tax=Wenzhouxiangella sp. XN79A TaxID=2724193 RepID=UPI00144A4F98|nr:proteobacterial dedicated sortase system response regulator [Wenzhouxiangella sp. XN79A]NKI34494.1 proteobacterial dedicated sortase system response regulator [Wenzhouxiangella sp. XN79A]
MPQRIAVVEDEAALRENYRDALARLGYRVETHADRASAQAAFERSLPDLVIIDIGLRDEPEGGFELCRYLRARSRRLPVLFLTARDSELDAVSGLRLGADDYLTKDISLPHLAARVAALFRRAGLSAADDDESGPVRLGLLSLDVDRLRAAWRSTAVELTVTEFWIVHALARRPGHVKTRGQLMDAANLVVDEATMTSHVKRIRRKFEALDPGFEAIDTVHGAGYRWREPE